MTACLPARANETVEVESWNSGEQQTPPRSPHRWERPDVFFAGLSRVNRQYWEGGKVIRSVEVVQKSFTIEIESCFGHITVARFIPRRSLCELRFL